MPTPHDPQPAPRILVRMAIASVSVMIAAWFVVVLDYQYQVAGLSRYVLWSDGLFLVGLLGLIVTLSAWSWGFARVRSLVLRLGFSIAVLIGTLAAGELAARKVLSHDLDVLANPAPAALNSLGFREREIGPKDPGRYRIIILGDSFTFGNFVEEKDRFSNQLQVMLGPRYEILNLGYPGNNLPDYLPALDRALTMKPDFILLQLYENDFETPGMMRHRPTSYTLLPLDTDSRLERESVLYRLIVDRWNVLQETIGFAERYTDYMARLLRDPESIDSREGVSELTEFIERARRAGVPTGGVLFPALYGLADHGREYPFEYLHERVGKLYKDTQTPYLDLMPAFLTIRDPRTLVVNRWDAHPNAKANHLAAIAIFNRFLPLWAH
jgi:GDSL-like lipase/acylhydrolase family protein